MKLYYPITVDLSQPYPMRKMTVPQNNIGRGASITLTWAGLVIDPADEVVELFAKRPDGYISYLPCIVEQKKVIADFTQEMLSAPGTVQVELQMLHEAEEITTPIFIVEVQRSNISAKEVLGSDDFKAFKDALDQVEELKKNGLKGDPGVAATIQVGNVTASDPGGAAAVSNSGTSQNAVFDFVLPRGQEGPPGPQGSVDTEGPIEFEDYTGEGAVIPAEETALAGITSGSSLKNVISNIKAFLLGIRKTTQDLSANMQGVVGQIQGILSPRSMQFLGVGTVTNGPIFNINDTCVQLVSLILPPGFNTANQPTVTAGGQTHPVLAKVDNSNPLNIDKNIYMQLFRPMAAYYKNGWQFIPLGLYVVYDGISTYLIISSQFQSDEALQLINGPMFLRGRLL